MNLGKEFGYNSNNCNNLNNGVQEVEALRPDERRPAGHFGGSQRVEEFEYQNRGD